MIERRSQPRVRIALRVNVSGLDAGCEGFSESVLATNLSQSGALLTRVQAELRCGDLVVIEYGKRQAHFRIVWVLDGAIGEGRQAAIHKLAGQDCPWEAVLPLQHAVATGDGKRIR